ncbi:MAG: hypothetical protein ABIZ30_03410 [Candidatus Limnocylindrales bacterium]
MVEIAVPRDRTTAERRDWGTAGLGVVAAVLLAAGPLVVFTQGVFINGPDAATSVAAFYADSGRSMLTLVAEPTAMVGLVLFVWFVGRLRERLPEAGGSTALLLSVGAGLFAGLYFVSIVVQTTIAGTLSFAPAFTVDPNLAMVLVHTAYVLMAGAMLGAAVMALAVARWVRGDPSVPRKLRPASLVVAGLSLASIFLAILPLLVVLIWIAALGIIASAQPGRPTVSAREGS